MMSVTRLPVSGVEVVLWLPAGVEDLLLLEAPVLDTSLALNLLARLVRSPGGGASVDCGALSVTDLDTLLLRLRQRAFGDLVRTSTTCRSPGCGKPIDISFRIDD